MKIYFAASIRGGRGDQELYFELIRHLQKHGEVLTEHIGEKNLSALGEDGKTDTFIHDRDMQWLSDSDVVVVEATQPSSGVGYEIGRMVERGGKRILCLCRPQEGKMLSAMISGSKDILNREYQTLDEAKEIIDLFFSSLIF